MYKIESRISEFRQQKGLTQKQLAEAIGVSRLQGGRKTQQEFWQAKLYFWLIFLVFRRIIF